MISITYLIEGNISFHLKGRRYKKWMEHCKKSLEEQGIPRLPIKKIALIKIVVGVGSVQYNVNMHDKAMKVDSMLKELGVIRKKGWIDMPNSRTELKLSMFAPYIKVTIMIDEHDFENRNIKYDHLPVTMINSKSF